MYAPIKNISADPDIDEKAGASSAYSLSLCLFSLYFGIYPSGFYYFIQ
jgi:hypothetical protein